MVPLSLSLCIQRYQTPTNGNLSFSLIDVTAMIAGLHRCCCLSTFVPSPLPVVVVVLASSATRQATTTTTISINKRAFLKHSSSATFCIHSITSTIRRSIVASSIQQNKNNSNSTQPEGIIKMSSTTRTWNVKPSPLKLRSPVPS